MDKLRSNDNIHTGSTSGGNYLPQYRPYHADGACPHCGYCPHCGRGGHQTQPPYWWYQPYTVCGSGGAVQNPDIWNKSITQLPTNPSAAGQYNTPPRTEFIG